MKNIVTVVVLTTAMLIGCTDATKDTSVTVTSWDENKGTVTAIVLNENKYSIKDIMITCLGKLQSGTMLHVGWAQKMWTFYPGVPITVTLTGISGGHPTYTRSCKITEATEVK